jgi:hypothetical protein
MLGLGSKIRPSTGRNASDRQGIFFDGTDDAVYTSNSDDEFSNWADFTIAVWLLPSSRVNIIKSGVNTLMSLGTHSSKGFDLFGYQGDIYITVGDSSDNTTVTANLNLDSSPVLAQLPGGHILVVARGDSSQEKIKLNAYHGAIADSTLSSASWNAHWGDPGTDVHLCIGGKDGTASGVQISQDWGNNSRIAQVGMWKEYLSDLNVADIWKSKNKPLNGLSLGTIRHHWDFNLGKTSFADTVQTAPKTMSILNDAKVRCW